MRRGATSRSIVANVGWNVLAKALVFCLKFVSVPILARLLSPAEFGVVATGLVVVVFLALVGGAGLAAGLIRAPEEDREAQDSVFWTNLAVAIGLGVLLYLFADPLAQLLGAPEAAWLLRVFAFLFPVHLGADVAAARLARRMAFAKEAFWSVVAELLAAAVAIAAALAGLGVWALVLQVYCSAAVRFGGLMVASRYLPRPRFSWIKVRGLLGYGSRIAGADVANFVAFQSPLVIITRVLGLSAAGAFSVANRLSDLPNQIVLTGLMGVLFPAFSGMAGEPERRTRTLLRSTQGTTVMLAPLFFGLWAVAEPATAVVLGGQWTYAWPVLGLLGVAKGIMSPCGSFIPYLRATGYAGLLWWFALARAIIYVAAVAAGALLGGLVGAMLALCFINVFIMIAYTAVVFRVAALTLRDALRCIALPMLNAVAMAAVVRLVLDNAPATLDGNLSRLVLGIGLGGAVYALLVLATQREFIASFHGLRRQA